MAKISVKPNVLQTIADNADYGASPVKGATTLPYTGGGMAQTMPYSGGGNVTPVTQTAVPTTQTAVPSSQTIAAKNSIKQQLNAQRTPTAASIDPNGIRASVNAAQNAMMAEDAARKDPFANIGRGTTVQQTGNGFYWMGGKMYSTLTGQEATQADYDAVRRISLAEGVDMGVAASMYQANLDNGNDYYGTGAEKLAVDAANRGPTPEYDPRISRLPGETNDEMLTRLLGTGEYTGYAANPQNAQSIYQQAISYYDGGNGSTSTPSAQEPVPAAQDLSQAPVYAGDRYDYTFPTGDYGPAPERNNVYEPEYQRLLRELEQYPSFRWDQNSDPVWAALAKQYRREGQRATADTLGQTAANTGGIGSSYAVTAAQQAGNYYAGQLADRLPEVYQQAYQRYLDEYSRRLGLADQYYNGMQFAEGQYQTDLGQYNTDRNFRYGVDSDNFNRAYELNQTDYNRYLDELGQYNTDRQLRISEDQRAIENAMSIAQQYGYVPNQQVADTLGLPVGTKTSDQAYRDWEQRYKDTALEADLARDERDFNYQKYLDDFDIGYQLDSTEYDRNQTSQSDAQQRIASFLSIGGDVSQLSPDLIAQSGYSKAELQAMADYYAQQSASYTAGGGSYGGGSGSGSGVVIGNGSGIGDGKGETGGDAEALLAVFPGGIVSNEKNWQSLVNIYGEDWLTRNGFRLVTPKSNNTETVSVPTAGYGSSNFSGIGRTPSDGFSASYFEDGADTFDSLESEYQSALQSTKNAVKFLRNRVGITPLTESEFSRSAAMKNQYQTYDRYISSLLNEAMQ